jgi:hypothetical protein
VNLLEAAPGDWRDGITVRRGAAIGFEAALISA